MAARDPFRGRTRYSPQLFGRAITELRRGGPHLDSAAAYLDRVAEEVATARPPSSTRSNPPPRRRGGKKPRRSGFVFPKTKSWPIGSRYHAKMAIRYMKMGRGVTLDYPATIRKYDKIRAAVKRRWSDDFEIRKMLRDLPSSRTLVEKVRRRRAAKKRRERRAA